MLFELPSELFELEPDELDFELEPWLELLLDELEPELYLPEEEDELPLDLDPEDDPLLLDPLLELPLLELPLLRDPPELPFCASTSPITKRKAINTASAFFILPHFLKELLFPNIIVAINKPKSSNFDKST